MGAPSNTPPAAPDAAGAREVTAFPYRRDWPSCPDLHRYFHTYTCVHSCAGTQTALPPRQRFAIVNDQVTRAYIPSGEAVGGPDQDTETKKSNGPRTTRNSTRVYPACQWRQEIRWSPSPTPGRAEPPAGPTSHRRSHHGRIFVFSPSVPREAGDIRMPSRKRGISRPPNPRNSEPPELRTSGTGAPGAGRRAPGAHRLAGPRAPGRCGEACPLSPEPDTSQASTKAPKNPLTPGSQPTAATGSPRR